MRLTHLSIDLNAIKKYQIEGAIVLALAASPAKVNAPVQITKDLWSQIVQMFRLNSADDLTDTLQKLNRSGAIKYSAVTADCYEVRINSSLSSIAYGDLSSDTQRRLKKHGFLHSDVAPLLTQYKREQTTFVEEEFYSYCLRTGVNASDLTLPQSWRPSEMSKRALLQKGIDPEFIDTCIPVFLLLTRESARPCQMPDSEFIAFASKRWQEYINGFDENTDFIALPSAWKPSDEVIKKLISKGIDVQSIAWYLPHFRLRESELGNVKRNWGIEFIRFCERAKS